MDAGLALFLGLLAALSPIACVCIYIAVDQYRSERRRRG